MMQYVVHSEMKGSNVSEIKVKGSEPNIQRKFCWFYNAENYNEFTA